MRSKSRLDDILLALWTLIIVVAIVHLYPQYIIDLGWTVVIVSILVIIIKDRAKSRKEVVKRYSFVRNVSRINFSINHGETFYYILFEGLNFVFKADLAISDLLPIIKVGDQIRIEAYNNGECIIIEKLSIKEMK